MDSLNQTAYCGVYCLDCIHYKNKYSAYAHQLKNDLGNIEFDKYAEINSGFLANFNNYKTFFEILNSLTSIQRDKTCRVGGGCSGKPCKIMDCCLSYGYEGCWECNDLTECDKFDILRPLCGEIPKNNIKQIKKHGIGNWVEQRGKFYIWQK